MAKKEKHAKLKVTFVHKSMYFQELRKKIEKEHPDWDILRLQKAYDLSKELHQHQKRKTGDPYIMHPSAVAKILYDVGGTEDMLCAGLLHDTLEDTDAEREHLEQLFGIRMAKIVELLSKEKSWQTKYCRMKSNLDEMESVWHEYPEAIIVKMADRLHNIQTLNGFISLEKKQACLIETKELLLPLFKQTLERGNFKPYFPIIRKLLKRLSTKVEAQFKKFNIQYLEQSAPCEPALERKEVISILKYEGWEGVRQVYMEVLEEAIKKGEPILAFEDNEEHDLFRKEFFDNYIQKRFASKVKAYVLGPNNASNRRYKKRAEGEFTEVTLLDNFNVETNINIVGDLLMTFSLNPIQGTIRRNYKEAKTFKTIFWKMWNMMKK